MLFGQNAASFAPERAVLMRGRAWMLVAHNAMQVRYLKVIEKSGYQALPWVRYITCAGNYELRFTS